MRIDSIQLSEKLAMSVDFNERNRYSSTVHCCSFFLGFARMTEDAGCDRFAAYENQLELYYSK